MTTTTDNATKHEPEKYLVDVTLCNAVVFAKLIQSVSHVIRSFGKMSFSQKGMSLSHGIPDTLEMLCSIPSTSFAQFYIDKPISFSINFKELAKTLKCVTLRKVRIIVPLLVIDDHKPLEDELHFVITCTDDNGNEYDFDETQAISSIAFSDHADEPNMEVVFGEHAGRQLLSSCFHKWITHMQKVQVRKLHILFEEDRLLVKGNNLHNKETAFKINTKVEDESYVSTEPFKPAYGIFSIEHLKQIVKAREVSQVVRLYMQDDMSAIGIEYPVIDKSSKTCVGTLLYGLIKLS